VLWFIACGLAATDAGCLGTPTPDPPDGDPQDAGPPSTPDDDLLPAPDASRISTSAPEITVEGGPVPQTVPPVTLLGAAGTVQAGLDVWVVNLDDSDVSPSTVSAARDGSFSVDIQAAPGDRVRLVARSRTRHSRPLDYITVQGQGRVSLSPLSPVASACLRITPAEELVLAASSQAAFALENTCDVEVLVTAAALRVAEEGFVLTAAPRIPARATASLGVRFDGSAPEEVGDVILLDVSEQGTERRLLLGVWAR
jgi:hypothetical protein